jgi:hypothetical protein
MKRPCKYFILALLILSSNLAWGEEKSVAYVVRMTENRPVIGLSWKKGPVSIRTMTVSDRKLGVAIMEGTFIRPGWKLMIHSDWVNVQDDGKFAVGLPLNDQMTRFDAVARGPGGEEERETDGIIFENWVEFKKVILEAEGKKMAPIPSSTVPIPDDVSGPWSVGFSPRVVAFSLNSYDLLNNAAASLNSIVSWGVEAHVNYRLLSTLDLFAFGQTFQVRPVIDATKMLSPATDLLFGGGVGQRYSPLPQWSFTSRESYEQAFFLRAIDVNTITYDNLFLPHLQVMADWTPFLLGTVPLGFGAGGGIYLGGSSANETVGTGYEITGRISATQTLGNIDGTLSLEYQHKSLGSSLATQIFDSFALVLSFDLSL